LVFRPSGYVRAMDERPETEEHTERESTERGEGPRDQPADREALHDVPTDRDRDEER
jgi:hypothetical protein